MPVHMRVQTEKSAIQVGCRRMRQAGAWQPNGCVWTKTIIAVLIGALAAPGWAVSASAKNARVTGLTHIAYYVTDLYRSREYYEGFLGFQEAFVLKGHDGQVRAAYVKINDREFIELLVETPQTKENHGYLHDVGFKTSDAESLRAHLASMGLKVPAEATRDAAGNLRFEVRDPSGFTLAVVQYLPNSMTGRSLGKSLPAARISTQIDHIGLLESNKEAAWAFYANAFGLEKEGNGSKMTIPGSFARFEIGFERKPATIARYHVKDHICLSVPNVPAVVAMLNAKPMAKNYRTIETHVLGNGKHVAELYDPDGNRIELMEPPQQKAAAVNRENQ